MAQIPPWLVPPDFVGAMRSGAGVGLQARSQDEAASEAGDRLRLAYDQLAAQEARAHETLVMHNQQQQAAMALRAQQNEALNVYRQQQIAAKAEAEKRQQENMLRLGTQFQQGQARLASQFDQSEEAKAAREERLGTQAQTREKLNQEREDRIAGRQLSPVKTAMLHADVGELSAIEKKLATTEPTAGLFHTGLLSNKGELKALSDRATELRKKIETDYPTTGDAAAPKAGAATGAVTTQAQYDALPSGTVYTGKDGKKYRKP